MLSVLAAKHSLCQKLCRFAEANCAFRNKCFQVEPARKHLQHNSVPDLLRRIIAVCLRYMFSSLTNWTANQLFSLNSLATRGGSNASKFCYAFSGLVVVVVVVVVDDDDDDDDDGGGGSDDDDRFPKF